MVLYLNLRGSPFGFSRDYAIQLSGGSNLARCHWDFLEVVLTDVIS